MYCGSSEDGYFAVAASAPALAACPSWTVRRKLQCADDFAVDNEREPAFDRVAPRRPSVRMPMPPCATRSSKTLLGRRKSSAVSAPCPQLREWNRLCVVEPVQHSRMAGAVENDYSHRPVVLHGLSRRLPSGFLAASRLIGEPRHCRGRRGAAGCSALPGRVLPTKNQRNNERAEPCLLVHPDAL